MKTLRRALTDALIEGSIASVTSAAALALRGHSESATRLAPLNAPSHWLWGDASLRENGPSVRYTVTGMLIHHASSIFWAIVQEVLLQPERGARSTTAQVLRNAAITTALAAVVDLRLAPNRLTPGFERRLSGPSLAGVYALFAVGLAVGSALIARRDVSHAAGK
jgi:hypothetical protein